MSAGAGSVDRALRSFEWVGRAACARDAALRDQLEGFRSSRPSKEALALCERPCPVRRECVHHAYRVGANYGWYGGLSPSHRRRLGSADAAVAWLEEHGGLLPLV